MATSRFFNMEIFFIEIILLGIFWLKILKYRTTQGKVISKCGNKLNPQDSSNTIC